MKIESITLREIRMRLKAPFETSFGVTQDRRILLVEMMADGLVGWGEVTAMETPSYNPETTGTAWHIIPEFLAPLILNREIASASEIPAHFAGIRGHNMAKAGLENAAYDIEAQQINQHRVGLGYIDDCFAISLNYITDYNYAGTTSTDQKVLVIINLRTLGGTSFSQAVNQNNSSNTGSGLGL